MLSGDQDVALAEKVEGATAGHAVYGGDHRLPEVVGLRAQPVAGIVVHEVVGRAVQRRRVVQGGKRLVAVNAHAKGLFAGPGQDDDVNLVVSA